MSQENLEIVRRCFRVYWPVLAVLGCLIATASADATYPGRNGRIAFFTSSQPGQGGVCCTETIKPNGRDRQPLGEFFGVSWSASGRRLVGSTSAGLVLADRRGQLLRAIGRPIGPDGQALFPYEPALSPDARAIAFVSDFSLPNAQPEQIVPWIWTVRADGTQLTRITPGSRPRWSPNARRIVFTDYTAFGASHGIASIRPDGRGQRILVGGHARLVDLAPDGRRLLWQGVRQATRRSPLVVGLFTIDLRDRHVDLISPSTPSAAWSPDGTKLVFAAGEPGYGLQGTFIAGANGGERRRLLRGAHDGLSWQPRPK